MEISKYLMLSRSLPVWSFNFYSPCGWCGVVVLPVVELTVIDGVDEFRVKCAPSCELLAVSLESWRESENRREFKPKLATPLVTFATSELKKLIFLYMSHFLVSFHSLHKWQSCYAPTLVKHYLSLARQYVCMFFDENKLFTKIKVDKDSSFRLPRHSLSLVSLSL